MAATSMAASSSCEPEAIDYIDGDDTVWEREPLEAWPREGRLARLPASAASGRTWTRCATSMVLEEFWQKREAQWKIW